MDVGWGTIWDLFHFAILSALLAGAVCPLVGAFLLVRRTGFYGVALPQFAAAGVAFGFALLPWWIDHVGLADLALDEALESPHAVKNYLFGWAGLFTFGGLYALVLLGKSKDTETGRVAAAFALATAVTILFAMASPTGGEYVQVLLRGEILTVDLHEFETIGVAYGLVLLGIVVYHRDMLLVSFDRDTAAVLGKSYRRFETLLMVLTGLTVSVGVLIVGPVVLFGLLVIPPLAARRVAWSMQAFYWLSSLFGVVAAAGGVALSFRLDWPLGPSVVAFAGLELFPALCWSRGRFVLASR